MQYNMRNQRTTTDPLQVALDTNAFMMPSNTLPAETGALFAMPTPAIQHGTMNEAADIDSLLWNQEDDDYFKGGDMPLNNLPEETMAPSFMQLLMAEPLPMETSAFHDPSWSETCLFNSPDFLPLGSAMLADVEEEKAAVAVNVNTKATLPPIPPIRSIYTKNVASDVGTPGAEHKIDKRKRRVFLIAFRQRARAIVFRTFETSKG